MDGFGPLQGPVAPKLSATGVLNVGGGTTGTITDASIKSTSVIQLTPLADIGEATVQTAQIFGAPRAGAVDVTTSGHDNNLLVHWAVYN